MGNSLSVKRRERERSLAIDKQIEEDWKKFRKECRILLLGFDELGKSRIMKQIKITQQNGYTREELMAYRYTIYKNLVESAQAIVLAMHKIGVDPADPIIRQYGEEISSFELPMDIDSYSLPEPLAIAIENIRKDPIMAQVMERSNEFYLVGSAGYFLNQVQRICSIGYIPSEADVLYARTKTTGITETRFNMGQLSIRMFDVGRPLSEFRKCIHCFEDVTSIIFCVALSEYDQVLLEEKEQSRMAESIVLFESVVNSRWFLRTSIILFLNEIDVFKAKLPKIPLERFFPEYTGGPDVNKAAKYILWKFTQTNRARLSVYPHLIQATDMSNIQLIFTAIKETILQNALRNSNIL
ncbi:hypothetical protein RSAG8_01296, partial [Rhizoctonia solani AG-8 WAC10335]